METQVTPAPFTNKKRISFLAKIRRHLVEFLGLKPDEALTIVLEEMDSIIYNAEKQELINDFNKN